MLLCHIKPTGCESTKEVTDNIDMTNLCIVFLIDLFHSVSHPVHPLCRKSYTFFLTPYIVFLSFDKCQQRIVISKQCLIMLLSDTR